MTGLMLLGIALVVCACGYFIYGRWLVRLWGVDPNARTPAYVHEDGNDYVPSSKFTVFAHQFSSITGAGPVTGPIIAAMFGWAPVMLWLMIGGIFFGAVQDFTALYASVKNEGKSMGMLIEQYIGKTGKKMFLLFSWLFTLLVTAAFADIVASTFNGFKADGALATPNAAAASISMLYIVVAIAFGYFLKKCPLAEGPKLVVAIVLMLAMLWGGIEYPLYFDKTTWLYVVFAYMFMAAVMPMWLLMEPRDYLSVFLLLGMIASGVLGVIFTNPSIELPAFNGFVVNGQPLFPILFITIACGAVSGFHSLVSSGTSSKTVSNEKDMLFIGYGSMLIESILAVVSLIVVGAAATGGVMPKGTPFQIFAGAVGGFMGMFGLSTHVRPFHPRGNLRYHHVRIRVGADDFGLRRAYRPYVLPGTVHVRQTGRNERLPETDDQQIFCNRYYAVLRLSALPRRIYERMAAVRRSQPALRSTGIHLAVGIP